MKLHEIIQIVLFFGIGIALTPVVGRFMARVFKGEKTFLDRKSTRLNSSH